MPADAKVSLTSERGFVPISTMVTDEESSLEFAETELGGTSGHVHGITDMVSV